MSVTRDKKLWPNTENFQFSNETSVPWLQFRNYVDSLVAHLPPDEQESVRVQATGLPGLMGVSLRYTQYIDSATLMAAQQKVLVDTLQAARSSGKGLSPQDLEDLATRYTAVALFPPDA